MSDQIGWEIAGRFYPHNGADALRHGDFALIREVTGLSLDEFDRGDDPLAVETGWLAVAVWHGNPEMRRSQVLNFIEQLPAEGAKRVGWEPELEDAETPLAQAESPDSGSSSSDSDSPPVADSSPSASPSTTKSPEDSTPASSILNGSGVQGSATGAISPPSISDPSTSAAA